MVSYTQYRNHTPFVLSYFSSCKSLLMLRDRGWRRQLLVDFSLDIVDKVLKNKFLPTEAWAEAVMAPPLDLQPSQCLLPLLHFVDIRLLHKTDFWIIHHQTHFIFFLGMHGLLGNKVGLCDWVFSAFLPGLAHENFPGNFPLFSAATGLWRIT